MPELSLKNLIVMDESGFPLNLIRPYARAVRGKRLKMPAPLHGRNVSAIGAISVKGIVDIALVDGSVDQKCIESFIKKALLPKMKRGDILVIDNAPVHNIAKINKELLSPIGAIALALPKYSPDLSPIEMFWSKLKGIIRKLTPRTLDDLYASFVDSIEDFEEEDFSGWFEHCGYHA